MSLSFTLRPVAFGDLEGWAHDDHAAALGALLKSCLGAPDGDAPPIDLAVKHAVTDGPSARAIFESRFVPHEVVAESCGLVTGYYEPEVLGSRTRSGRFCVPVYARPPELTTRVAETERARFNETVTGFRATPLGEVPYHTRAEIEAGALQDRGLELLYLDDWVELFFMQVQGSGRVRLDDGTALRLSYVGKNGYPYTSIAKLLIERGALAPGDIDMDTVKTWLHADPARGRRLMQENESFIFFRILDEDEGRTGPLGALGVPLTPGRSLAVDTAYISLGTPVFVTAPDLDTLAGKAFRRLMIAQDVGSAIRGPQRGDIFWGTGPDAGAIAGRTRHAARFHVLRPKLEPEALRGSS